MLNIHILSEYYIFFRPQESLGKLTHLHSERQVGACAIVVIPTYILIQMDYNLGELQVVKWV